MSVVHKSVDLDVLARELRKHGKVLSRCDSCGQLFTDVRNAMLHRKVHIAVTILLPRTPDKEHLSAEEEEKDSVSTSTSDKTESGGQEAVDTGQLDYTIIMEAIANANSTMTFGDLQRLTSQLIQVKKQSHVVDDVQVTTNNVGGAAESHISKPHSDHESSSESRNKSSYDSKSVTMFDPQSTIKHQETITDLSVAVESDSYRTDVNHDVQAEKSSHSLTSPESHEKRVSCEQKEFVESLDTGVAGETPEISKDRDHLMQQLTSGSSFLQFLNEPLDDSVDALYDSSQYNSHRPNSADFNSSHFNTQSSDCSSTNTEICNPQMSKSDCVYRENCVKTHDKTNSESLVTDTDSPRSSCPYKPNTISSYVDKSDTRSSDFVRTNTRSSHKTTDERKVYNDGQTGRETESENQNHQSGNNYESQCKKKQIMTKVSDSFKNKSPDTNCSSSGEESTQNVSVNSCSGDDISMDRTENETNKNSSVRHSEGFSTTKVSSSGKSVISLSLLPCRHCSVRFETLSQLIHHTSASHNIIISKCSKCGQIFYDADAVKKHLLVHKPIVPLGPKAALKRYGKTLEKCRMCGQEFGNSELFRNHLKCHPYPYVFTPESLSCVGDDDAAVKSEVAVDKGSDDQHIEEDVGGCKRKKVTRKEKNKNVKSVESLPRRKSTKICEDKTENSIRLRLRSSSKNKLK